MKLKPYPKYKSSGVKWIGDIPEHWGVKKLKYICSEAAVYGANINSEEYTLDGMRFLRTTDITDEGELIPEENAVHVSPESVKGYVLDNGDILFSRSGTLGRCLLFDKDRLGECAYAGYLVKFKVDKENLPAFVYYFSKSKNFGSWMSMIVIESTIGNINGQKYANMTLPIPSPDAQKKMILFLDKEISQIENLIEKYKELIDLLKEKRTALISQVVTKGLNPNVKMKDSGIEWVGEVPEHWGVKRLKRIFNIYNGSTPKSTDPVNWDGDIVWITPDDLGSLNSKYIEDSARNITEVGYKSCGTTLAPKSSIIISTRAPIGHLGIANTTLCTNQGCRSLVPKSRANSSYFYYLLIRAKSKLNSEGQGATFMELSKGKLGMIFLCNPSLEEQKQISDYLNSETSRIDTLIEKINKHIELLKEHKTSLISHVVTGKVDVIGVVE